MAAPKKNTGGKNVGDKNFRSGKRFPGVKAAANRRKEMAKLNSEKDSKKAPGGSTSSGTGAGNKEVKGAMGTRKVLKAQKGGAGTPRIRNVESSDDQADRDAFNLDKKGRPKK